MAEKRAAGLFDLRSVLALLFAVYGFVLTVLGIAFTTQEDLDKAAGTNVNLWMGIGMLGVALLFALWVRVRPLTVPEPESDQDA
ncbi:hypothetical protein [Actinokineospora globicatena]|uniref:Uncharacterized protein n=1 Tax=Actinokineospora globicatena TaxID=103729 RepID=A0A9W6QN66_9PSEU|nr:hypothetical protein [Actinokineospora globicatena]MCP2302474.1 hypothetical protein [Actinokineospora globicatena]GLW75842.1 hypothetical protein Aglo01_03240 [Actinokineospora globicatena]GLW82680.1 hypothetical protein Aglo02_03210 [Actinokineospora globicatena]GLW91627.1 hypothetical protein Aglo03_24430 [Actinokineospora globicatena]